MIKFLANVTIGYGGVLALSFVIGWSLGRFGAADSMVRDVGIAFYAISWCGVVHIAASDWLTARQFRERRLDGERSAEFMVYQMSLAAWRHRAALASAAVALLAHLVIEGVIQRTFVGQASLSEIGIWRVMLQFGMFYLLAEMTLPRFNGTGPRRRTRASRRRSLFRRPIPKVDTLRPNRRSN